MWGGMGEGSGQKRDLFYCILKKILTSNFFEIVKTGAKIFQLSQLFL